MSLVTQLQTLATRIATECKSLRTLINGNAADLSALTTTVKTNLVAAINEVQSEVGAAGATTLTDLTDVTISAPDTGHIVRHNGAGQFVNVLGTTYFDAQGDAAAAQAAAIAASQPLHANLTSLAAVAATAYGRSVLTAADQAALTAFLAAATELLPGIVEKATQAEVLTGTDAVRYVAPIDLQAKIDALVAAAPGLLNTLDELALALGDDPNFATTMTTSLAGKQALHAALTSISGLTTLADRAIYTTALNTYAVYTLTAYGRTIAAFADAAAARTSIDVYSKAEIGDPATNFVTSFDAGLV